MAEQSDEQERLGRRPNWSWVRLRLALWRCHHDWMVGDRKSGAKACAGCSVWRWFPLITSRPGTAT